ncbi:MAG: hypothetical protein IFK93_12705, partial [Acidobacteria bacterium]|nr:hypothetical protein [Candidatus Sulfomarinibacter kjeldsenii]
MKNIAIFAVFAILLTFSVSAQVPETPKDVAAPPADAVCTDSGLCSRVQVAGSGEEHPEAWDSVTVHYSGWTTDG